MLKLCDVYCNGFFRENKLHSSSENLTKSSTNNVSFSKPMILIEKQNEDIENILEEINYTKGLDVIKYNISQYKNGVYSISSDIETHYFSNEVSLVIKGSITFDEPVFNCKLVFDNFMMNSNTGFREPLYLSNTLVIKGRSYKLMIFTSSEQMLLIRRYIDNRVHKTIKSYDCISIGEPQDILINLVNSSII